MTGRGVKVHDRNERICLRTAIRVQLLHDFSDDLADGLHSFDIVFRLFIRFVEIFQ